MNVGLVGWLSATGNGAMNGDIARLAPWVTKVLGVRHPKLGHHAPYVAPIADKVTQCRPAGEPAIYDAWLDGLDAVLFVEMPYLRGGYDLVATCRNRGIRTCCIPMWEWWSESAAWPTQVDAVYCVTQFTHEYMVRQAAMRESRWRDNVHQGRWGVDLDRFPFQVREKCNKFLCVNGQGGWAGRKGAAVVAEAAKQSHVPIHLTTQTNRSLNMPACVDVHVGNFETRAECYQGGDVLLAPSHWEGLGHQLYEAQACGLPVITTDAPPMNECGTDLLIQCWMERQRVNGRMVPKAMPSADALAERMKFLHGQDIEDRSVRGRRHIEAHHNLVDVLDDLQGCISKVLE